MQIRNSLDDKNYDKALKLFREKIIQILYSEEIIQVNKRYVKNGILNCGLVSDELAAVYNYYEGAQNNSCTFLGTVKRFVRYLHDDSGMSPTEMKEKYFGEDYFDLQTYLTKDRDKLLFKGFKHNSFSRKKVDDIIIPYLEKIYKESGNFKECILQYPVLDQIYMGHGFPFACVYGGTKYFHGYDRQYRKLFEGGINSLQRFYEGKSDKKIERIAAKFLPEIHTYEGLVDVLCDGQHEEVLRILFPFRLLPENITSEKLDGATWNEFIYEFARLYCSVKELRNASVHMKDLENEKVQREIEDLERALELVANIQNKVKHKR